jgi:glycosyltransferase involved in cell wall biosynthesis
MKILLVNKFLYPKGGAETYVFNLGETLQKMGHDVEYFGMEHKDNIVGNRSGQFTSAMDFHCDSFAEMIFNSSKIIYSSESRRKIRKVLDDFKPDVCHLNNFNYQLTPSIILEIVKWRKESGNDCKIVYTAHDLQLVCPNHLMLNPVTGKTCEKCLEGKFYNCATQKCVHGSPAKSVFGALEAYYWNARKVYGYLDAVISPSKFLAEKLMSCRELNNKITVIQNFVGITGLQNITKGNYVLYFGRYSKERSKGVLSNRCRLRYYGRRYGYRSYCSRIRRRRPYRRG